MVATLAIAALVMTTMQDEVTVLREAVSEAISEDAFITVTESKEHKVLSSLVELRAYCLLARSKSSDYSKMAINVDHGLIGFIKGFGKPLPSDSEKGSWTEAEKIQHAENPFNVAKTYNAVIASIKNEHNQQGLSMYVIRHLEAAVSTGKKVLTTSQNEDGKDIVHFNRKAIGLEETPKYFLVLGVSASKFQVTEASVIAEAHKAAKTKQETIVKESVVKMVTQDLNPKSSSEARREAAVQATLNKEVKDMKDKAKETQADAKKAAVKKAEAAAEEEAKKGDKCAVEGGKCSCKGTVKYGAGIKWIEATSSASVACSNAHFGQDPSPGVKKTCKCIPGAYKCANEGGVCKCQGSVQYGAEAKWTSKASTKEISCTNFIFNDPAPGLKKACMCTETK